MLRRQHFVGEVTVDHREGKLSLSVNPDDTNKGGANSKKSLSGVLCAGVVRPLRFLVSLPLAR